ncbi:hypothetical protein HDU86_001844 [Geranomyces michiganensis]|nr:hypothetical protein HDU86_001844 [Geranomyces michiganensis]
MAAVVIHHTSNSNNATTHHRSLLPLQHQDSLQPQPSPLSIMHMPHQQQQQQQPASPPPSPAKKLQLQRGDSGHHHGQQQQQQQNQKKQLALQQQPHQRRDTLAIKQELCRELGIHADVYWRKLRDFLNGKCDRLDFDRLASRLLIKRKVTLHNRLIMAILHNVYKSSAPPPPPPALPTLHRIPPPSSVASTAAACSFPHAPTPAPSLSASGDHKPHHALPSTPMEFSSTTTSPTKQPSIPQTTSDATTSNALRPLHPPPPQQHQQQPNERALVIQRKRKAEAALPDWRVKLRRREVMSFSSGSRQRIVNLVPKRMLHAPNPAPPPEPISPPLHAHPQTEHFFNTNTSNDPSTRPHPSHLPALAFETRLLPSQDTIRSQIQLIVAAEASDLPEGCGNEQQADECAKLVDRALQAYMMNTLTGILRCTKRRRWGGEKGKEEEREKERERQREKVRRGDVKIGDRGHLHKGLHGVGSSGVAHGITTTTMATNAHGAAAATGIRQHIDEQKHHHAYLFGDHHHTTTGSSPPRHHTITTTNTITTPSANDDNDEGAKSTTYVGLADCLFAATLHPSWFTRAHWLVEEATAMLDEFEGTIEDTVGDIRRHR